MKNDSLKVFLKVFVRLFSIFAYFCSAMCVFFLLKELDLSKSTIELVGEIIAIVHLVLLVALWKEFSGSEK